MNDERLYLQVKNRETTLYQGEVRAITSYNEVGTFDVLPEHANFISLIQKSLIIHELRGSKNEIKFDVALLRVSENKVEIYLGITSLGKNPES